jgi:hypothetical protein
VLLVFGAPGQLPSLAGQEHGRTIPLAEVWSRDNRPSWQNIIELTRLVLLLNQGNALCLITSE